MVREPGLAPSHAGPLGDFHSSLPSQLKASTISTSSKSPAVKIIPSAIETPEYPWPHAEYVHTKGGPPSGQRFIKPVSGEMFVRPGPWNSGQCGRSRPATAPLAPISCWTSWTEPLSFALGPELLSWARAGSLASLRHKPRLTTTANTAAAPTAKVTDLTFIALLAGSARLSRWVSNARVDHPEIPEPSGVLQNSRILRQHQATGHCRWPLPAQSRTLAHWAGMAEVRHRVQGRRCVCPELDKPADRRPWQKETRQSWLWGAWEAPPIVRCSAFCSRPKVGAGSWHSASTADLLQAGLRSQAQGRPSQCRSRLVRWVAPVR